MIFILLLQVLSVDFVIYLHSFVVVLDIVENHVFIFRLYSLYSEGLCGLFQYCWLLLQFY